MLKIAFSPVYKYELPDGHRFPMIKYELLPQQLLYEGIVSKAHFFTPDQLTDEEILLTHTESYYLKLEKLQLTSKEIRKIGFPVRKSLIERGKYIAKGTYLCALESLNSKGVALNIAGGTHHAYADHGEGFCVFNDIAIASNLLLKRNQANKIMVVDLDVHQGNGTAKIFENEDRVFTFSMHGEKNYPVRKEKSDLDIGLPDKCTSELYISTLRNNLPRLLDEFRPDLVFYLSGVDIIESDKLGRLAVSISACKERDRTVFEACKKRHIPVAVCMGGGYPDNTVDLINAHANTFKEAQYVWE